MSLPTGLLASDCEAAWGEETLHRSKNSDSELVIVSTTAATLQAPLDDRHARRRAFLSRPSYAAAVCLFFFACSCGFAASQEMIVLTPDFKPLHRAFLTLAHSTAYMTFAAVELGWDGWSPAQRVVPLRDYALVSVFCFLSVFLANLSLSHIEYSTRVMFKCAKPLPTMALCSCLIKGDSYSPLEYFGVALLGLGLATCIVGESATGGADVLPRLGPDAVSGFALAFGAIFADSFVSTYEHVYIFGRNRNVLPAELVFYTYAFTAVGSLVAFGISSEPAHAVEFFTAHPRVLLSVFASELFGYASISCVVRLIANFGAAPAELAKTARKGVTYVLSYVVLEGKPLTRIHAKGASLFALGTALSVIGQRRRTTGTPGRSKPREIKGFNL